MCVGGGVLSKYSAVELRSQPCLCSVKKIVSWEGCACLNWAFCFRAFWIWTLHTSTHFHIQSLFNFFPPRFSVAVFHVHSVSRSDQFRVCLDWAAVLDSAHIEALPRPFVLCRTLAVSVSQYKPHWCHPGLLLCVFGLLGKSCQRTSSLYCLELRVSCCLATDENGLSFPFCCVCCGISLSRRWQSPEPPFVTCHNIREWDQSGASLFLYWQSYFFKHVSLPLTLPAFCSSFSASWSNTVC